MRGGGDGLYLFSVLFCARFFPGKGRGREGVATLVFSSFFSRFLENVITVMDVGKGKELGGSGYI